MRLAGGSGSSSLLLTARLSAHSRLGGCPAWTETGPLSASPRISIETPDLFPLGLPASSTCPRCPGHSRDPDALGPEQGSPLVPCPVGLPVPPLLRSQYVQDSGTN